MLQAEICHIEKSKICHLYFIHCLTFDITSSGCNTLIDGTIVASCIYIFTYVCISRYVITLRISRYVITLRISRYVITLRISRYVPSLPVIPPELRFFQFDTVFLNSSTYRELKLISYLILYHFITCIICGTFQRMINLMKVINEVRVQR